MKITLARDLKWGRNDSENVEIGFSENFDFNGMNFVHAKIRAGEALKMHRHDRKGGCEVFCFFKGGHFKILTKDKEKEFDTKDVVYASFEDGEAHSVENLSEEELEFQAFYSPGFVTGEVSSVD